MLSIMKVEGDMESSLLSLWEKGTILLPATGSSCARLKGKVLAISPKKIQMTINIPITVRNAL